MCLACCCDVDVPCDRVVVITGLVVIGVQLAGAGLVVPPPGRCCYLLTPNAQWLECWRSSRWLLCVPCQSDMAGTDPGDLWDPAEVSKRRWQEVCPLSMFLAPVPVPAAGA